MIVVGMGLPLQSIGPLRVPDAVQRAAEEAWRASGGGLGVWVEGSGLEANPLSGEAVGGVCNPPPPVEPGPPAKTADHRNFHRLDHGGARDRPGIGEIEAGGAGVLQ